jgi:hypothetical protein
MGTIAAHRYESPAEPESGVHRVAEKVGPASGPTFDDPTHTARLALAQALVTIANLAARLGNGVAR